MDQTLPAALAVIGNVYDMLKAADRGMEMHGIRVLAKSGGRSGDWVAG
jgi:cyclic pyranopterin phosphate synthase